MGTAEFNAEVNPVMDLHPIQGGVEILLVASCYKNQDKLRPNCHLAPRMVTLSLPTWDICEQMYSLYLLD